MKSASTEAWQQVVSPQTAPAAGGAWPEGARPVCRVHRGWSRPSEKDPPDRSGARRGEAGRGRGRAAWEQAGTPEVPHFLLIVPCLTGATHSITTQPPPFIKCSGKKRILCTK
ncbi:hypothetical protein NDU88_006842 [Pleurodeles waltl]|uniref:Uncharacterized protein n=1 Tax=Pleurodeles waltl TaxID=8319 RepID=A0AAV7MIG9_PLEWA|nr:hypothetical protein NDU88_006842 [Pleurodeles waltl]